MPWAALWLSSAIDIMLIIDSTSHNCLTNNVKSINLLCTLMQFLNYSTVAHNGPNSLTTIYYWFHCFSVFIVAFYLYVLYMIQNFILGFLSFSSFLFFFCQIYTHCFFRIASEFMLDIFCLLTTENRPLLLQCGNAGVILYGLRSCDVLH